MAEELKKSITSSNIDLSMSHLGVIHEGHLRAETPHFGGQARRTQRLHT
jgi:hypothetical protein